MTGVATDTRRPRSSVTDWFIVAGCALAAGGLVLLATRHGVTVEQDSTIYISAARNLAAGRGFQDFAGEPITIFPPLFPAVLRGVMWFQVSAETAARFVNAAALAASVVLAYLLIRRHVRSRWLCLGATVVVASSIGLLHVADKAFSEPLFALFVLPFLLLMETAIDAPTRRGYALCAVAGLIVGLAFLVRYASVVFIGVGVASLLVSWWTNRSPGFWIRASAFVGTSIVLPALWLARNATSSNKDLVGPRVPRTLNPATLVSKSASAIGSTFLPGRLASLYSAFFYVLLVAALVAIAITIKLRDQIPDAPGATLIPLSAFVVIYVPFAAIAASRLGIDISYRIYSPLFIPLVALGASFLGMLCRWAATHGQRRIVHGVVIVGTAFVVALAAGTVYDAGHLSADAHGYTGPSYRSSPLTRRVAALPPGVLVVTPDPYRLYGSTARQPIVQSPGIRTATDLVPASVASLAHHAACRGPVYLAWYGRVDQGFPTSRKPASLARELKLTTVATVADGSLYEIAAPMDNSTIAC
jgi:hypothetical protein